MNSLPGSGFGSSPLARGLPAAVRRGIWEPRIIPARAGFTRAHSTPTRATRDHPRSRGVYGIANVLVLHRLGSSPLARGLLPGGVPRQGHRRIIPARAGFTGQLLAQVRGRRDHPRSRGVYTAIRRRTWRTCGSSPLARGLLLKVVEAGIGLRIIPARAGFTAREIDSAAAPGDHPRSRGVYPPAGRTGPGNRGSSPLARGLPLDTTAQTSAQGIIPARAGFTSGAPPESDRPGDHPRSRGVYALGRHWACEPQGSSPLARGLRSCGLLVVGGVGIIPARAGFTPEFGGAQRRGGDHPRSRGVYSRGCAGP